MIHTKPRYPVHEGLALIGLPRSSGYVRLKQGMLRVQKDGRRSYITAEEIDRYVRGVSGNPIIPTRGNRNFPTHH
jgi:hypothetical protein